MQGAGHTTLDISEAQESTTVLIQISDMIEMENEKILKLKTDIEVLLNNVTQGFESVEKQIRIHANSTVEKVKQDEALLLEEVNKQKERHCDPLQKKLIKLEQLQNKLANMDTDHCVNDTQQHAEMRKKQKDLNSVLEGLHQEMDQIETDLQMLQKPAGLGFIRTEFSNLGRIQVQ